MMKFLCDVHISHKIVSHLRSLGYESIHVNDILNGSESKDAEICKYSDEHNFTLITKDSDFKTSFFVKKTPKKLIKINLGNIPNNEIIEILSENINALHKLEFRDNFILEIDKDNINLIELD